VIYLVVTGYFSTFMLLILFAAQRALYAVMALSKPRPEGPPQGFEAFWPTWFSGFCFYHNRAFGGLFILGVLLDTLVRKLPIELPLSANWLGAIALGIGLVIAVVRMQIAKAKKS
jgi:prepilin signal peptidase PulO-like enzyme (type II secretory pathway)